MRKNNEKKYIRAIELKKQGVKRSEIAKELQVNVRTISIWTKHIPRVIKLKSKEEKLKIRRDWYDNNSEKVKNGVKKRSDKISLWWQEFKSSLFCTECPEDHISCIVFHHKDPNKKEINLGNAVNSGWSKKRILKEVKKCIVLCSNCHRKLHYNQKALVSPLATNQTKG